MRYFVILFCVASCLAGTGEALADPSPDAPDCDAIKTTLIPYQIRLTKEHSVWRELHTIQMTRSTSGYDEIFARVSSTTSYKLKSISLNGSRTTSDRQYFKGEFTSQIERSTLEYEGIDPKQADYRTDLSFVLKEKFERIDGKEFDRVVLYDVSYKYRTTERVTIAPCVFVAHIGETTITDKKTGKTAQYFNWHFPELRLLIGNQSPDVTFHSISTTFDPIEFAEPIWPPAPSKTGH